MVASPLCTVLIPVFNAENTLQETVESALGQTYTQLEILLIDDGSTDGSLALAHHLAQQDSRIRVLENEKNQGVVFTRNRGFKEARGEYIAFLDADDIWLPQKIEKQITCLKSMEADICYTAYELLKGNSSAKKIYSVPVKASFNKLLRENFIGASTICLKANLAQKHSMNNDYAHEDYVFSLDLFSDGAVGIGINEVLMQYRVCANSRSGEKNKAAKNRWIIYRKHLGFSVVKSFYYFVQYAWHGVWKHFL